MSKISKQQLSEYCFSYQNLVASQKTLLLSTISEDHQPEISYAPYVRDQQGDFYIFVSELAAHTRNLFANHCASIMFLRPESETRELFARERVIYKCNAMEVAAENKIFEQQLAVFHEHFGEIISVLKSLSDFHLFALQPVSGQYVLGFGQAYIIDLTDGHLRQVKKSD